jgi:hypothetical protein
MMLNDKPNCQVSRMLMKPRLIYVKRSEYDSKFFEKKIIFIFHF